MWFSVVCTLTNITVVKSCCEFTRLRLVRPKHFDHSDCDDAYSLSMIRVQTTLNHTRFVKFTQGIQQLEIRKKNIAQVSFSFTLRYFLCCCGGLGSFKVIAMSCNFSGVHSAYPRLRLAEIALKFINQCLT